MNPCYLGHMVLVVSIDMHFGNLPNEMLKVVRIRFKEFENRVQ